MLFGRMPFEHAVSLRGASLTVHQKLKAYRHVGAPILRNTIGKTRTDCQMMLANSCRLSDDARALNKDK